MKWISGCAIAISGLTAFGCGGEDIRSFEGYGTGMPGSGLDVGGEIMLEKVHLSGGLTGSGAVVQNWFHVMQMGGAGYDAPTAAPSPGECYEFNHTPGPNDSYPMWQVNDEAEWSDFGANITFSGPGFEDGIDVPRFIAGPEGQQDNRGGNPNRLLPEGSIIYGGPQWQYENFQDIDVEAEAEYVVDLGDAGTFNFFMPRAYDFPLNIGTEEVEMPRTAPDGGWEITWDPLLNPDTLHSKTHDFTFVTLIQFPGEIGPDQVMTGTARYICQPANGEDGRVVIPQSIIDDMPDAGIIQAGRVTHFMEALEGPDGVERRFDLYAIYCSLSSYSKVD